MENAARGRDFGIVILMADGAAGGVYDGWDGRAGLDASAGHG